MDEELLAVHVGRSWPHYRDALHRLSQDRPVWNWAAALVPFWLAHRKFYGLQIIAIGVFVGLTALGYWWVDLEPFRVGWWQRLPPVAAFLMVGVLEGLLGDRLVIGRAREIASLDGIAGRTREQTLDQLRRRGGVSLVVPVLLLAPVMAAAFTIMFQPRFCCGDPGTVPRVLLKSDLRNLVTAQESYFADHVTYAGSLTATMRDPYDTTRTIPLFLPSPGVTITLGGVSGTGWNATATTTVRGTSHTCSIWIGSAPKPDSAANEGEPRC